MPDHAFGINFEQPVGDGDLEHRSSIDFGNGVIRNHALLRDDVSQSDPNEHSEGTGLGGGIVHPAILTAACAESISQPEQQAAA